jgi:organic hydroperoxide reductase OsmC/OhrA
MTEDTSDPRTTGPDGSPAIVRTARVSWLARPPHGYGYVHAGSGAFTELALSFGGSDGKPPVSTPGELLAAADASALTLILSRLLQRAGTPADELIVTAEHTFTGEWYQVDAVHFRLTARVPGATPDAIDEATLRSVEQWRLSLGMRADRAVTIESNLVT